MARWTIGTLDGANVEILEHVGDENIFIFGLKAEEVEARRRQGLDASEAIAASPILSDVITAIESGVYSPEEPHRFRPITQALRHADYYMVAADFEAYFHTQRRIEKLWLSRGEWDRASIMNIARMDGFHPTGRSANMRGHLESSVPGSWNAAPTGWHIVCCATIRWASNVRFLPKL